MSIGKNIKQIRKEHNLTQKQLAKIAGVTDKAVSMWEMDNREPRMGAIQKIADYLGVPKSKIIDEPPFDMTICEQQGRKIFEKNGTSSVTPSMHRGASDINNTAYENIIPPGEYMWLSQRDDSMAPFILKRDKLLIHLTATAKNGLYSAVIVDKQDINIRKVITENESLTLVSDNPYYPKHTFTGKECGRVQIVGVLKKIIREI